MPYASSPFSIWLRKRCLHFSSCQKLLEMIITTITRIVSHFLEWERNFLQTFLVGTPVTNMADIACRRLRRNYFYDFALTLEAISFLSATHDFFSFFIIIKMQESYLWSRFYHLRKYFFISLIYSNVNSLFVASKPQTHFLWSVCPHRAWINYTVLRNLFHSLSDFFSQPQRFRSEILVHKRQKLLNFSTFSLKTILTYPYR